MKKICFVLIVLGMVLLCGCDGNSASSSSVNDSSQGENGGTAYSIAKGNDLELRIYSPDGSNYIREEIDYDVMDEEWGELYPVNIYLNEETKPLEKVLTDYLYKYGYPPRAVWLDNKNLIVCGQFILNLKTMQTEDIAFDKLDFAVKIYMGLQDERTLPSDHYTMVNYAVDKSKTKIAYLLSGGDYELYIYTYDLKDQSWNKIYFEPSAISEGSPDSIDWDDQGNLYFSALKNIYKYDGQTVVVFYATDTILFHMAVSPLGRYMVVSNEGGKLGQDNNLPTQFSYIDLADGKVKFTFTGLEDSYNDMPFTWSSDDKAFAYVDTDGAVKVISLSDMGELLSRKVENPEEIDQMDYWNSTFVYF